MIKKDKSKKENSDKSNTGVKKSGSNIHDLLFKHMMKVISNVICFIKNYVSKDIVDELDFDTLKQVSNVIPNDNLTENQIDAMYEVKLKNSDNEVFT